MMRSDVPEFVDGICKHLLREMPDDLARTTIQHLEAGTLGYTGGCVVAGQNVGGGWVRVIDAEGNVRCALDKLPFQSGVGMQLVAVSPKDSSVFVVTNASATAPQGAVTKYTADGELSALLEFPRAVSAVHIDRTSGHVFVSLKGGGAVVLQSNGSRMNEFAIPTAWAMHASKASDTLWVLTQKAIERRTLSTGQLEHAIHLPDSMLTPSSLAVGEKHVWASAPNPDGSANFAGGFDFMGRSMNLYVPSTGSLIVYDPRRGGVWQMPRQAHGHLVFHNEGGIKVMTADLGKARTLNMCCDAATGLLWVLKVSSIDEATVGLYDPMRQTYNVTVALPEMVGHVTHITPL
jgi:hypothetical protein